MGRLIDADALKNSMFHYAAPEMVWDRGDIEHKINETPTIDAIPIDAIPVEWLMDLANRGDFVHDTIAWWMQEQEAKDG